MTAILDLTSDLYQSPGARGAFSPHKYQSSPTWTTNQWQTNLNAVLSPCYNYDMHTHATTEERNEQFYERYDMS